MPNPLGRWQKENEAEHAHYAVIAGFEKDLSRYDILVDIYDEMPLMAKLALFSLVVELLEEAMK